MLEESPAAQPLRADLTAAIGSVAAGFDRASVGEEIGLAVARSIPQLARSADDELVQESILAATANVVAIMDGLLGGIEPDKIAVPNVSLKWAELLVSRNIDASAVPWAYNFGLGRMADALREVAGRLELPAEERWQLNEGLARYVQLYVESACAQMVGHFVHVEEEWVQTTPALRREIVRRLLGSELVDETAASRELGFRLDRPLLAAIVWSSCEPEGRPAPHAYERAVETLLRSCGATDVVTVANGQSSVWAWGAGPALTDQPNSGVMSDPSMLGAIGTIEPGIDGFIRSHHDAQRARKIAALLARRPRSVVSYRSVALTSLIAQDPGEALRFIETELGPLTADTDSARRLRATLSVYLEEGMRPVRAARRLGVHQNTVAYRIAQAEEAIGRPLAERRLELEIALKLADARDALRASPGS